MPSMAEVLPWIDLVTDELMLCKDGSLLASFEFRGLDYDNVTEAGLDSSLEQLLKSYSSFDERISAWWIITKKRDAPYPVAKFVNPVAQKLDDCVKKHFDSGEVFTFTYQLHLLYTGETGVFKYMDTVARLVNEDGMSYFKALIKASLPGQSVANAALYDQGQLMGNVEEFERVITNFMGSLPFMGLSRLSGDVLRNALYREANISFPTYSRVRVPEGRLFDAWAAQSEVDVSRKSIRVSNAFGDRHISQLRINEYPLEMRPMMLESTLSMDTECKVCLYIRFMSQNKARSVIDGVADYYKMTQFSLLGRGLKAITNKEPTPDQSKIDLLSETMEAKRQQQNQQLPFVYMSLSVSVVSQSSKDLERATNEVVSKLTDVGFGVAREFLGCLPAYFSTIPGQYSCNVRAAGPISGAVAALASPIFTVNAGNPVHSFFSEVLDRKVPAFSVFKNSYGGAVNFSPHLGQVGHMLIVAPSGGGKTTFANFALSQFQRYATPDKPVRTIVFDRNYSCRITTVLHGGKHIDLKSGRMKLNPISALLEQTEDSRRWVREYITRRIEEGNDIVNAEMRNQLDDAIRVLQERARENPEFIPTMTDVRGMLHGNLKQILAEWCEGGAYANFDNEVDDFDLADWTCIEMQAIMDSERLAMAFIDHVFRKIMLSLDGTLTFIYLEEASFLLNSPTFLPVIEEWLKTIRKLGGFLWLTVQSPEAIPDNSAGKSILDNVLSVLYLSNINANAHREIYKKSFALTDEQVDEIKSLVPQREYMLVSNGVSRVMQMILDQQSLAYLRSEAKLQNKFVQLAASDDSNWQSKYLEYASSI